MVINRTTMFQGGIRPHLYCLPVAKRERHRLALRAAATSGHSSFFAGTDTAPHLRTSKEAPCGCAGIFAAPTALQTYAQVFDDEKALDALEGFLSINGAAFYGMPRNVGSITLERTPSRAEKVLELAGNEIVVFRGGEELPWSIKEGVQ